LISDIIASILNRPAVIDYPNCQHIINRSKSIILAVNILITCVFETKAYNLFGRGQNLGFVDIAGEGVPRVPSQSWDSPLHVNKYLSIELFVQDIPRHPSAIVCEQEAELALLIQKVKRTS
jgi:hypothetical protein